MKITLGELKKHGACEHRYKHLCECLKKDGHKINNNTEMSMLDILNYNGFDDVLWAIFTTQIYEDYCLILTDMMESAIRRYNSCDSIHILVNDIVNGIKNYINGKITKDELNEMAKKTYPAMTKSEYELYLLSNIRKICLTAHWPTLPSAVENPLNDLFHAATYIAIHGKLEFDTLNIVDIISSIAFYSKLFDMSLGKFETPTTMRDSQLIESEEILRKFLTL